MHFKNKLKIIIKQLQVLFLVTCKTITTQITITHPVLDEHIQAVLANVAYVMVMVTLNTIVAGVVDILAVNIAVLAMVLGRCIIKTSLSQF
jgi:hypothetical protein